MLKVEELYMMGKKLIKMSVKPLLCPICGAQISLGENECKYCGVNYVVESGKVIINPIDMKKIEHREKLIRNNLPDAVLQSLASYPKEKIIYTFEWAGIMDEGKKFLVTSEKMVLFQENRIKWIVPFENFGGVQWGQEASILAALSGTPKISMKIKDLKNDAWRKLPAVTISGIEEFQILELKISNAYNLWLTKK